VRHEAALDPLAAGGHEGRRQPQPVQTSASGTGIPEHERQPWQTGQLRVVTVAPERDVIAEPPRHLRRVGYPAHPGQNGDEVEGRSLVVI